MNYKHAHNWPLFKAVPILRILIPFVIGIVFNLCEFPLVKFFLLSGGLMLVCILLYHSLFKRINHQIVFYFVFVVLGYSHVYLSRENYFTDYFEVLPNGSTTIIVNSIPEVKSKSVKLFAKVVRVGNNKSSGQVLLYIKKDNTSIKIKYGDELMLAMNCKSIENIPYSNFDYRQYLANKQVYHQAYIKTNEWQLLNHHHGNYFVSLAYHYREKCGVVLKNSLHSQEAIAVASALLIGDDDAIPKSVYQAYTDSGTIHVLSVSGMHVGVIYLLLVTLFGRMERNKYLRVIYFILMLVFIWMYSVLSGSSASVLRAATMLTVIIIGKWINGNSPIYNSLVLSMFVLLLYNPFYLTDKGFLLSYLAVYGIVYLQPKIISLWKIKNMVGYKIWEFTSVSIAAQIMTLPISLLLFGKFPNYFILANWVVIPLSTLAIYLSIAQVVFQKWTIVLSVISYCNEKIICFMDNFLKSLTSIKGAVTNNIYSSTIECILLYCVLLSIVDWLSTKRYGTLILFLFGYALLLVINIFSIVQSLKFTQFESFIHANSFLCIF
ncbi:MAG: ComEC/Rec2 family competence protein [Bacteroidota bacterium]